MRKSLARLHDKACMAVSAMGARVLVSPAFPNETDEEYGAMDAFLTEMGVDQNARRALVASLTTEQPKLVMGQ